MLAKLATLLVLTAVCLAFPAEDLKPPATQGLVDAKPAAAGPEGPEDASDLQTDSTFWLGRSYKHHHYYPVYRSYYRPRAYSYSHYDYEPYYYSTWW